MNKYNSIQYMNVYSKEYIASYTNLETCMREFMELCQKNMLGSNVVEGVLSGTPANSSVSEIGDVARKTNVKELEDKKIAHLKSIEKDMGLMM